jgi:hypothetical protein
MALDMNPGIRAQWCAALRSGEYAQTDEALRRLEEENGHPAGYCCLGVLTDLYVKAGNDETYNGCANVWESDTLTGPVMRWAGLDDDNPWLDGGPGRRRAAAEWNDDEGATFAEIADLIDGGAS